MVEPEFRHRVTALQTVYLNIQALGRLNAAGPGDNFTQSFLARRSLGETRQMDGSRHPLALVLFAHWTRRFIEPLEAVFSTIIRFDEIVSLSVPQSCHEE